MPQNICFRATFIRKLYSFRNKGLGLMEQKSMSVFYLQIISVVSNYCPAGGHFFFPPTFLKFSKRCKENSGLQTQPCEIGRAAAPVRYQGLRAGRPLLTCRVL